MNTWDLPNLDSICNICHQEYTDISSRLEVCIECGEFLSYSFKFSGLI